MDQQAGNAARVVGGVGHLAVWAALYQVGALAVLSEAMGLGVGGWAYGGVGLIALSTYLKDRVKLRRIYLDPADEMAHPARAAFLRGRAGAVRVVMGVALVGGMGCMGMVHPVLAAVGPAAWAGVIWYGRPRQGGARRPKDVVVVKNLIVAGSIGGMVWVVGAVADGGLRGWDSAQWLAGVVVLAAIVVQVFGDAVICDLDDRESDARFGTRTIVVSRGERTAWVVAIGAQISVSAGLVVCGMFGVIEQLPALVWGIGSAVGTGLTVVVRRGVRRDATDAKLAVVGGIVLALRAI